VIIYWWWGCFCVREVLCGRNSGCLFVFFGSNSGELLLFNKNFLLTTLSCNDSVNSCPIMGKYIFSDSLGQGESNGVIFIEFQSVGGEILSFTDGPWKFWSPFLFYCPTLSLNISVSFCRITGNFISLDSLGHGESNGVIVSKFQSLVVEISSFFVRARNYDF